MIACADTAVGCRPDHGFMSRIHVLLSTYNGAPYLRAQLDSLLAQTHADWVLHWRDDGSSDATAAILDGFAASAGPSRCHRIAEPAGRIGPAASFMALLRATVADLGPTDTVAFIDQDDVWLPEKLSRAVAALASCDPVRPAMYCARLMAVDANLHPLVATSITQQHCEFPASLTQNIATGCTIMLNRRAATLVADSVLPSASMHDWWCYVLVTAADGQVLVDESVVALYRQHGGNCIGMRASNAQRAVAAIRRGPKVFMNALRQHVAALIEQSELISDSARPVALQLHHALHGSFRARVAALRLRGLRRQTWLETALFRVWFLIG
ncbi:MAG TPA: glycosyltransferase [Acetobacteraceae bacterium]|jgi:glycosyltransferase involved in cell wall biosynthesis